MITPDEIIDLILLGKVEVWQRQEGEVQGIKKRSLTTIRKASGASLTYAPSRLHSQ